ncbi:MAG: pectate lyase [Blastocatellia bacterium]|nr:MAG: pectate lyase [Blastocatellia bacterium]
MIVGHPLTSFSSFKSNVSRRTLATIMFLTAPFVLAQTGSQVRWKEILKQPDTWYASPDATRIADNVLVYQRESGGWPKNIDMAQPLDEKAKADLAQHQKDIDSTIDNGATYIQLSFLARTFTARKLERHREAFLKGFDYLLKAQYSNGGWPQFYPDLRGYYKHITYNDDAMIGVMTLLRDVAEKRSNFLFVDDERRHKASVAVQNGIECILKTQVVVGGKRTVWCAQHDEITLAPAKARTYELPSLSGGESVGIIRFLMSIEKPTPAVIDAIKSAVEWFQESQLTGIKWVATPDNSKLHGFDRIVIRDPSAGPLWARFYEIETNRPIFVGRDGVVKYNVAEIEDERRNGYSWYVDSAVSLLKDDYPKWLKKQQH